MTGYTPQKQHLPIDPDVKLPAAIRAASARSDALHKSAYEAEAPVAEVTPGDGNKQAPTATVGTPPAPQATQPPVNAPQATTTPAPVQQPTPDQNSNSQSNSQADDWQHKYNSLKGRYDTQEQTIANQSNRIRNLEGLLAAQAATPAATPAELQFKPITPKDREEFGDEFLDVAARAAAEKLVPELKTLRETVTSLQSAIGAQAETARANSVQNVYKTLDDKLSNWRAINKDANFLAWAGLPDPMSGVIRQALMRDAFAQGDADRVLRFFNGYLAEAAPSPAIPAPPANGGKVPLEQFAAPGRASAPAAPNSGEPGVDEEIITHAQITKFYADVARGVYRGNDADKNELEARIFAAQKAGRVR